MARWRVGLVAYRAAARAEEPDQDCFNAGVSAMLAAYPEMVEARREMCEAFGWVTRSEYADWFRQGMPSKTWIWRPTPEGVGHYRNTK